MKKVLTIVGIVALAVAAALGVTITRKIKKRKGE